MKLPDAVEEIERIYFTSPTLPARKASIGQAYPDREAMDSYLSYLKAQRLAARPRLVIDCGHGAACRLAGAVQLPGRGNGDAARYPGRQPD